MTSARTVYPATIFLLFFAVSVCTAESYYYSFESGTMEGWTADATDQGQCQWHIIPSQKLAYHGSWSLEYFMRNINDATKIWIERFYEVPAGRRYDVLLTWKLASRDAPVGSCPIIAYIGDHDLETRNDDIQIVGYSQADGGGSWVWLSESYLRTGVLPGTSSVPGTGQGRIWIAIGMWGTFEVDFTWYVDSVTVEITESTPPLSIGQARQAADGTRVFLKTKAASTGSSDLKPPSFYIRRIYVQEPDRSAGVMVKHYRTLKGDPARGDVLDVSGIMATEDGERVIEGATISWPRAQQSIAVEPICMGNKSVGGGPFGSYVPGTAGSVGLNNSGLLIRSFGKVISTGANYFVIDDGGRNYSCGKSAVNGLAVSTADALLGIVMPPEQSYVTVTGISGMFSNSGLYYPIIRLRSQGDLRQIPP